MSRWLKAISALARTPPLLIAQKIVRRVPFRPADIGKLCFLRLDGIPDVSESMLRGNAAVRFATLADLQALSDLQHKEPVFRERFSRGDRCVVAQADKRVIAYEWFTDDPIHHESAWGLPIAIPSGFVYAYDAYIDPAYRNTGIWLRFKAFLGEWMRAGHKQGVLTFVEFGNWPSLRTHLRFGFTPTESVLAVNLMGLKIFRKVRPISPTCLSYVVCLLVRHAHAMTWSPVMHHVVRGIHLAARV